MPGTLDRAQRLVAAISTPRLFQPTAEHWGPDGVRRGRLYRLQSGLGRLLGERLFSRRLPGIDGRVHLHDAMLAGDDAERRAHYRRVGESAWEAIAAALAARRVRTEPLSVLDLPCGHGRVTRVLRSHLPSARLHVSDVDREAVRFCAAEFGATPVPAPADVRDLRLPPRYDLVWCGSLLTHLDDACTASLLATLIGALAPEGVAVFTTHGEACVEHLGLYGEQFAAHGAVWRAALEAGGMGYAPYHPGVPAWGVAVHSRAFIERTMAQLPAEQVAFRARGWDDHQDVWTYRRIA